MLSIFDVRNLTSLELLVRAGSFLLSLHKLKINLEIADADIHVPPDGNK